MTIVDTPRHCRSCGQPLAPGASFCRGCGARVAPAPPATAEQAPPTEASSPPPPPERPSAPPAPKPPRRGRAILIGVLALLAVAAGVGAAIALLGGGDSKTKASPGTASTPPTTTTTTTPTQTSQISPAQAPPNATVPAAAIGTIAAGRYVQAGSFRTVAGAETERRRLEDDGIGVDVADSDQAKELYPGFQVLLGGPFHNSADEQALLGRLRDDGVPSAFARPLSPARAIAGPEAIAGSWTGTLDRTGSTQPGLNGSLAVTLTAPGDGRRATLDFTGLSCEVDLSLKAATDVSLAYGQASGCVGGGTWNLRPSGESLAVALLPPDTDVIVLGTLSR